MTKNSARIGAAQVERFAAHVDHREIGRQIILAQDAGIGFRCRFREQNVAGYVRHDHFGSSER